MRLSRLENRAAESKPASRKATLARAGSANPTARRVIRTWSAFGKLAVTATMRSQR